jgi:tetratricopeptide (TPR) repeat protein
MNKTISLFWVLTIGLLFGLGLSSCNGAKAYTKKGAKMESAGMIDQAADCYFTALQKKPAHIDALTGLKRTGQQVLSRILVTFDQALVLNDRQSAIEAFKKAEDYHNKAVAFGVTLLFPDSKKAEYENVTNAHVEELYGVATEHLESNRYVESLRLFEEIVSLIPTYKDAKVLADYSFCKPAYELGIQAMENNLYRTAYEEFDKVYKRDASFEDASQIREEALIAGRYTIALMKFENGSNRRNINTKLSSIVEELLLNSNDPFLMIVERESLELILQEQHLELSGLTSGSELEIGSILGAKAILKGTVTDCSISTTPLRHDNKRGYQRYRVETVDAEGKKGYTTKYKSVGYAEYYQSTEASMSFTLKLISMETGAILSSETVKTTKSDQVRYIKYGGEAAYLYAANTNGSVNTSSNSHNQIVSLTNERRDLKSDNLLVDDLTKVIASKVQTEIESIIQDQVK